MCSVIGIVGDNCLDDLVLACGDLQNRGSDSAGLAIYDSAECAVRTPVRGVGSSDEVFGEINPSQYHGDMGIAHGRYVTRGKSVIGDVQPLYTQRPGLILAFNGQINNYDNAKRTLPNDGWTFFTGNDLEALMFILAHNLWALKEWKADDPETFFHEKLCRAVEMLMTESDEHSYVSGAYATVGLMPGRGVFGFRDPYGIRPLEFGSKEEAEKPRKQRYMIASETHPMDRMRYEHEGEVKPGELVFIDTQRRVHRKLIQQARTTTPCVFELVYFSRGVSENRGRPIREWRRRIGEHFAKNNPQLKEMCDIVTAIPKTPIPCGAAIAAKFGLEFCEMETNEGAGRTFLANTQRAREEMARHKFAYDRCFTGKRVLVVDDSLVRGNVSRVVVEQLFNRGAREIHLAIMYGQNRHPCPYGIDTPDRLMSAICGGDPKKIAAAITPVKYADRRVTVTFNTERRLLESLDTLPGKACTACMNGIYPTGDRYINEHVRARSVEVRRSEDGRYTSNQSNNKPK